VGTDWVQAEGLQGGITILTWSGNARPTTSPSRRAQLDSSLTQITQPIERRCNGIGWTTQRYDAVQRDVLSWHEETRLCKPAAYCEPV